LSLQYFAMQLIKLSKINNLMEMHYSIIILIQDFQLVNKLAVSAVYCLSDAMSRSW